MGDVLSERIAEQLQRDIKSGLFEPGDRLLQEQVAERFAASRFPVREAFRILEIRGLVNLEANRGARVTKLTSAECDELYRLRELIEPELIRESVPHLTPAQIDNIIQLEKAVAAADAEGDVQSYLDLDWQFHRETYAGADSHTMLDLVDKFVRTTYFYRRAYYSLVHKEQDGRGWVLQHDHPLIVDAVQRGDAKEASLAMRMHIRRARKFLAQKQEIFD